MGRHNRQHGRANTFNTEMKLPIEVELKVSSQNWGSLKRWEEETSGCEVSVVWVPGMEKATEAPGALGTATSRAPEN